MVDDLDPASFDERALFHLLNLAREDEAYVLMTGRALPSAFPVELRDLRSRLRAVSVVMLTPPDDQLFRALIVKFCADRQMTVDESIVSYLGHPDRALVRGGAAGGRIARWGGPAAAPAVTRALAAEVLKDPAV